MSKRRKNSDLKKFYESSYKVSESEIFTFFKNVKYSSENNPTALDLVDWTGKTVHDVGCGTGMVVRGISTRGAKKVGG